MKLLFFNRTTSYIIIPQYSGDVHLFDLVFYQKKTWILYIVKELKKINTDLLFFKGYFHYFHLAHTSPLLWEKTMTLMAIVCLLSRVLCWVFPNINCCRRFLLLLCELWKQKGKHFHFPSFYVKMKTYWLYILLCAQWLKKQIIT